MTIYHSFSWDHWFSTFLLFPRKISLDENLRRSSKVLIHSNNNKDPANQNKNRWGQIKQKISYHYSYNFIVIYILIEIEIFTKAYCYLHNYFVVKIYTFSRKRSSPGVLLSAEIRSGELNTKRDPMINFETHKK